MVVRTYEQALKAGLDHVIVATDNEKIVEICRIHNVNVIMTRNDHNSGTDRAAEVAERLPEYKYIINIQGDEPLIDPNLICEVAKSLLPDEHGTQAEISTACKRINKQKDTISPDVVKVITDLNGNALYFSRLPIPFSRNGQKSNHDKHLGIYGYTRKALLKFSSLPPTDLERTEKLEQLRALANGMTIRVIRTEHDSIGVDTQKDLERVRDLIKQQRNSDK